MGPPAFFFKTASAISGLLHFTIYFRISLSTSRNPLLGFYWHLVEFQSILGAVCNIESSILWTWSVSLVIRSYFISVMSDSFQSRWLDLFTGIWSFWCVCVCVLFIHYFLLVYKNTIKFCTLTLYLVTLKILIVDSNRWDSFESSAYKIILFVNNNIVFLVLHVYAFYYVFLPIAGKNLQQNVNTNGDGKQWMSLPSLWFLRESSHTFSQVFCSYSLSD